MGAVLRPDPERSSALSAGVVALALTVLILNVRFGDEWGTGIHLVYSAAAAALVIMLAMSAPDTSGPPPAWHSTLFLASFVLALAALANLADVLGSDDGISATGTIVWVGALLAGLMFRFASRFDSGISTLIGALTLVAVAVAFVDWAFSPEGADTFRWILLFTAIALAVFGQNARADRPHHAVGFVNAAGVAILAIAFTYASLLLGGDISGVGSDGDASTWWELVLLAGGAGLIAHAAAKDRSGPGYLGVANLLAFVAISGGADEGGASLFGWPLLLLVVTALLLVLALRRIDPRT